MHGIGSIVSQDLLSDQSVVYPSAQISCVQSSKDEIDEIIPHSIDGKKERISPSHQQPNHAANIREKCGGNILSNGFENISV